MPIIIAILTFVIMWFYGRFVLELINEHQYFWLVVLFILPFIWGRYVSTDWEKEQDAANFRAWKQKWRYRFSRIWPVSGEILPKDPALQPPAQCDVRKFPKSS